MLTYSTYVGGSFNDMARGVTVDAVGHAYVTGGTNSADFPVTAGAFQGTLRGGISNAFVARLDATGSALLYSTYLGGGVFDEGRGIAVDSMGNVYVTGATQSGDFPVTAGAFQTTSGRAGDVFVVKLDPTGSVLVYSSYLGGEW